MRKKFIARQTSVCIGSNKSRTAIVRTFKNDLMRGGPPFAGRWDAKGVTPLEATCCTSVTHDALIPSSVSEDLPPCLSHLIRFRRLSFTL